MNQPLFGRQTQYQICVKYYDSKGIRTGKADTLLSFSKATFAKCILTCGIPMATQSDFMVVGRKSFDLNTT